jgi:hypothetical protein
VLRASGDIAEIELFQKFANAPLMQDDREAILDTIAQIGATPTHDTIFLTIRTGLHPRFDFAQLLTGQAWFAAGSGPVQQSSQPVGVVSMHPVSQRLAIHAASLRCQQT